MAQNFQIQFQNIVLGNCISPIIKKGFKKGRFYLFHHCQNRYLTQLTRFMISLTFYFGFHHYN
jgi:hypothetical protein